MLLTDVTKARLAYAREERDMIADGWERVGEGGGMLWELQRGFRWSHVITDVKVALDGKSLWIKTAERATLPQHANN